MLQNVKSPEPDDYINSGGNYTNRTQNDSGSKIKHTRLLKDDSLPKII